MTTQLQLINIIIIIVVVVVIVIIIVIIIIIIIIIIVVVVVVVVVVVIIIIIIVIIIIQDFRYTDELQCVQFTCSLGWKEKALKPNWSWGTSSKSVRIILKWMLGKQVIRTWTGMKWLYDHFQRKALG